MLPSLEFVVSSGIEGLTEGEEWDRVMKMRIVKAIAADSKARLRVMAMMLV